MIPKIIHQVWEAGVECLPDFDKMLSETWKEYHPEWQYEFWDRDRMENFVYDYYPELVDIYFGYQYHVQRWHLIRYLILYRMGGLYADFDYECLEPFDSYMTDDGKCYFAMEPEQHRCDPGKNIYFNNALMIAPPGHPFFKYMITRLLTMSASYIYTGDKYHDVLTTTGLLMLTNVYEDYADKSRVDFFPAEQVSPFSKNEVQDYMNRKADEALLEKKLQKAIAIHYFFGSWLSALISKQGLIYTPVVDLYRIFKQYPVVCTDFQDCLPNSLFFVTRSSIDVSNLVKEALKSGCRYAIVDDPAVITDNRYLLVDDVGQTLMQLANYHRQILQTPVIGITGTCGKTTTKELTAAILATKYNLIYTHESQNKSSSMPLHLLRLTSEHEMAVIEMGAGGPGGIRELVRIARPNYGIITMVGLAHLGGFGSLEGVIRAKGELYNYLRETTGKIFIHKENMHLQSIAGGLEQITYGESKDAFVSGRVVSADPCLCFEWENAGVRHTVSTQLAGDYNLCNALAAITVGLYFGVPAEEINRAISEYVPTNCRSQWKRTLHNELLIDCFNANPTSMQAALANFASLAAKPKAVILGDMHDLGVDSIKLYAEIIEKLNGYGFEKILLCGEQFLATGSGYQCFPNGNILCQYLSSNPLQGYHILIKGASKLDWRLVIDLL